MTTAKQHFERYGWVVIKDALPRDACIELSRRLIDGAAAGQATRDPQCPLSDSFYSLPEMDGLLARLAQPIGDTLGKRLLPTYSYARVYRKGEELKRHRDRPECEISATLTLDYPAGQAIWPIYFGEARVDLLAGELALYKGCDVEHWRAPFRGEWQTQIFLHYVDADGPYRDRAFDGRGSLASERKTVVDQAQPTRRPVWYPGLVYSIDQNYVPDLMVLPCFTDEECARIVKIAEGGYGEQASIGTIESNRNEQVRKAEVFSIDYSPETSWIFDRISERVLKANELYRFDLAGITHGLQLLKYDEPATATDVPGHYDEHCDWGPGKAATRKISASVQLSDPRDYEGGDLVVKTTTGEWVAAPKHRGAIAIFPSFAWHEVKPVTAGTRWAIVIWVHGHVPFR